MKALKTVGMVVGVVALAATGIGLAGGLGIMSVATASTIATVASVAAGVISVGTSLFAPKPSFTTQGNALAFQTNPQSGVPYAIGRTRMSGLRIHGETYDAPSWKSESKQDVLAFAVLLTACGPIQEIESFRADKVAITFDAGSGAAIGSYNDWMAQKVALGGDATALNLNFGGQWFPGWSADHKLSGMAHALWCLRFDFKGNRYGAGVPEPEWIGKWVKVYDPRKDSTYPGGSGSHRALTEATYEWSSNPALHALTWALGRWANGKRVMGVGAPIENIRVGDFVEAANVADANGWTCGGVEWSTDSKWSILKRMLQAGGAEPTMTGAMIGCRVNMPRISVATVTGADLLDSLSGATTRSRRDRFNTAIPRFRSEEHEWQVISGSPISVPLFVTQDGGPRTKEIDFPLVQAETGGNGDDQAGQLAAYEIVNSREGGPIRFTVGPKFIGVKTGDVVTLDVPDEGFAAQPVLIRRRSIDPTSFKITFEAETETDEKHDFALGKTTVPPPSFGLTPPDLTPPTPATALWSLAPTLSSEIPALAVNGVCEFPGADSVLIEYRRSSAADWTTAGKFDASSPVKALISPVEGGVLYYARVAYQSGNRIGDWRVLGPITTSHGELDAVIANFNGRNDRNGSPVVAPTIPGGGAAIEHTLNTDGSADIAFDWNWSGNEADIDFYEVMAVGRASSAAYAPGSSPDIEVVFTVPPNRTVYALKGVAANLYWTFAVRAVRAVDPDINASRFIRSAWVKSTVSGENPYRPSANVAFLGDISQTAGFAPVLYTPNTTLNMYASGPDGGCQLLSGQLPIRVQMARMKGAIDVSSSASWSIVKAWNVDATVSSSGLLTITAATDPNAYVIVSSTYESVPMRYTVVLESRFAMPRVGPGETLYTAEVDGSNSVTSTSFVNMGPVFSASSGPNGGIRLSHLFAARSTAKSADGIGVFRSEVQLLRRPVGGSFTSIASGGNYPVRYDDVAPRWMTGAVFADMTGLSANTAYEFQLQVRKTTQWYDGDTPAPSVGSVAPSGSVVPIQTTAVGY